MSLQTWGYTMLRQDHYAKTSISTCSIVWLRVCGLVLAAGCLSANNTRKASSLKSTKNVQSSAPELEFAESIDAGPLFG